MGRRRELAEIRKALVAARLVSLVGPGGVGKTRLAVRAATDHQRGFADGAWWVDLAEIRDPALVATPVVAALDLRDQAASTPVQVLLSHLRDRQLLLVLDNCEHVAVTVTLSTVALLAVTACAGTSTEPTATVPPVSPAATPTAATPSQTPSNPPATEEPKPVTTIRITVADRTISGSRPVLARPGTATPMVRPPDVADLNRIVRL